MLLSQIKKQARSFLHEKYKTARLTLTDVTEAELLAEEATNNDPWGPDAKTMTTIAVASYDIDDYWRIVDVLHSRLDIDSIDWKNWRQCYKSLVLLEFLVTHGPEELAQEFLCDTDAIEELGTFQYIDEKGFNWGINMQKRSQRILQLLKGGIILVEARLKALKISKEIQGYGNSMLSSPSSSASSPSSASMSSRNSFFGSCNNSPANSILNETVFSRQSSPTKEDDDHDHIGNYSHGGVQEMKTAKTLNKNNEESEGFHLWDCPPIEETGSLLGPENEDGEEENNKEDGLFITGAYSKLGEDNNISSPNSKQRHGQKGALRSFSDIRRLIKKKYDRQLSMGY